MAIKDQCSNCKYDASCSLVRNYDNTSCSSYSKRINLNKGTLDNTPSSPAISSVGSPSPSSEPTPVYDFDVDERSFWQKLFSFKGRNNRGTYWLIAICINLLFLPANLAGDDMGGGIAVFTLLIFIPAFWILLANVTKRLHDLGHSGWYILLLLIPLVNIFAGIWIAFWPGNSGSNEYGPVP